MSSARALAALFFAERHLATGAASAQTYPNRPVTSWCVSLAARPT